MKAHRASCRRGFTLMELLTTLIVVGILAGVAIPKLQAAIYSAEAARVAADMTLVRTAMFQFREENGSLPSTSDWGAIPPDLVPYLNIQFTYKDLDYRLVTTDGQGRIDFKVRYAVESKIGVALQRFSRPGSEAGSVLWTALEMRWRLLEDNG